MSCWGWSPQQGLGSHPKTDLKDQPVEIPVYSGQVTSWGPQLPPSARPLAVLPPTGKRATEGKKGCLSFLVSSLQV